MGLWIFFVFYSIILVSAQFGCDLKSVQPAGTWYTAKDAQAGVWRFYNTAKGTTPQVLKGISITGFETGTRSSGSGAGYWLYQAQQESGNASAAIIQNVVKTLASQWKAKVVRIPICGSGWLQNYLVKGYGGIKEPIPYRDWVDIAVCEALRQDVVVLLDVHLWAIGKETNTARNVGMEDGCTGINRVSGTDSCAPHDWYGAYTSNRTGKTYNTGDDPTDWQCSIANADGCTLDNLFRAGNNGVLGTEHFYNLWYELATRYSGISNVWFELFNEPYQRKSAEFGVNCDHGVCPPGYGFGDNIDESEYGWDNWSELMDNSIKIIRDIVKAENIVIVSALDWSYDWLGKGGSSTGGPLARVNDLLPWVGRFVKNIAYAFHPYQHGACCGQIGDSSDLSQNDPYQSAFCLYPPVGKDGLPVPSHSPVPIPNTKCDSTGYAETQNKKSPACVWAPNGVMPPPPPPIPPPAQCTFLNGQNLHGKDINDGTKNTQPSAPYCCDDCASTPGCVGFTFVTGSGQCWLKSSIDSPSSDGSVVSGTPNHTIAAEFFHTNKREISLPKPKQEFQNLPFLEKFYAQGGFCAGDRDLCGNLTQAQCLAVDWRSPSAGGWSKYVLGMMAYGPLIASEHGSFDCSSPFESALTAWLAKFGVSYTAWALWPQNSGGPGQGACGYPSVMFPTASESDGFGKGSKNCDTLENCVAFLQPLGWSGDVVFKDISKG